MSEDKPTDALPDGVEYTSINVAGVASTTQVFQPGLTPVQRQDVVAYLRELIEVVEKNRALNVEIKVTNETAAVPEGCVVNHIPTGIKVVDLMIRFA